jgi:hypothetical protein
MLSNNNVAERTHQVSAPEELVPGLVRFWMFNKQLVVFKATMSTRNVVDTWISSVKTVMADWPMTQPYLVIHDFRDGNIAFTPYARSHTEELIKIPIGVPGYAAIILPRTFVSTVIRLFMRVQKSGGIENRLFFDYDEGLAWLTTKMGSVSKS